MIRDTSPVEARIPIVRPRAAGVAIAIERFLTPIALSLGGLLLIWMLARMLRAAVAGAL